MGSDEAPLVSAGFDTGRLRLRPWRVADAAFHRSLWLERDPRVPAHRRIGLDGRPTVAEMEDWIRAYVPAPTPGLLVVRTQGLSAPIGYCGLIPNSLGSSDEPELAFEFLRASWNNGFATEGSRGIIESARESGYRSLISTVREWNGASLRVLEKLGFVDSGSRETDEEHGDLLLLRLSL